MSEREREKNKKKKNKKSKKKWNNISNNNTTIATTTITTETKPRTGRRGIVSSNLKTLSALTVITLKPVDLSKQTETNTKSC